MILFKFSKSLFTVNIFLQNISQNILPYEEFNYGTKYLFIRVLLLFLFNGVALFFREFLLAENITR